jgi:RNA recognition motif-containing protein
MDSAEGAKKAIEILSGSNLDGKLVYISKAKPIKGGDNNMEKTL